MTRTAGWLGNVALGGMTLADVFAGTNTVGNMTKDINRMLNYPMDRKGNVIRDINKIKNLRNVAQRDILNPNEMRLASERLSNNPGITSFDTTRYNPREMNAGGIVSLMI